MASDGGGKLPQSSVVFPLVFHAGIQQQGLSATASVPKKQHCLDQSNYYALSKNSKIYTIKLATK